MLIRLKELLDEDSHLLMAVYKESNKENIAYFFPEIKDPEKGLQMAEEAYVRWLKDEFLKKGNTSCYVWKENGIWKSSLRLHQVTHECYYIEALETHPEYRKQGYAEKLLNSLIDELKEKGAFRIESYTSTKNIASQKTHKKCGFILKGGSPFDYANQEYVDDALGFVYNYNAIHKNIILE